MKLDATAIAAALLHDAVEDTPATSAEISAKFGEQVAHIVEGVTKIDKIQFANREDRQAENVRKMLLAMVTDVRVVLIKLADRLHNMRTLEHLRPDRQEVIARETMDIYAPLAHRLGMGKVRGELEDLAFRYTDPVSYERIAEGVESAAAGRRAVSARRGRHARGAAQGKRHPGAGGVEDQAALLHLPEDPADQELVRPRARLPGHPRRHPGCGCLLRGVRPDPRAVAAGSRPDQGLHRHSAGQRIPVPAHHRDGRRRPPVRGADPHRGDAPHCGRRHRGALEVQGGRGCNYGARRGAAEVDPPACGVAEGDGGSQRIPLQPEDGSLPRRGLHLHAQGQSCDCARGWDAGGLCLHHSHRGGPHLCGRQGERTHGAAQDQAAHRRRGGDCHPEGAQAQPRLAQFCKEPACAEQDQALAQRGHSAGGRWRSDASCWRKRRASTRCR